MNQQDKNREDFEAWHNKQYIGNDPFEWDEQIGVYRDFDHNRAFGAWQAAKEHERGQREEPVAWPTEPVSVPSDDEIEEMAHRMCFKYSHSDDRDSRQYTFGKLTLHQFSRALLAKYAK